MSKVTPIDIDFEILSVYEGQVDFILNSSKVNKMYYGHHNDLYDQTNPLVELVKFAELVRNDETGTIVLYAEENGARNKLTFNKNEDGSIKFEVSFPQRVGPMIGENSFLYCNESTSRKHILNWLHKVARTVADDIGFTWGLALHCYGNDERLDDPGIKKAEDWLKPRVKQLDERYESAFDRLGTLDNSDPEYWQVRKQTDEYFALLARLESWAENKFFTMTPKQEKALKLYKKMLYELKLPNFEEF